jgi:hypothetical protein
MEYYDTPTGYLIYHTTLYVLKGVRTMGRLLRGGKDGSTGDCCRAYSFNWVVNKYY